MKFMLGYTLNQNVAVLCPDGHQHALICSGPEQGKWVEHADFPPAICTEPVEAENAASAASAFHGGDLRHAISAALISHNPYDDEDALETSHDVRERNHVTIQFRDDPKLLRPIHIRRITRQDAERICRKLAHAGPVPVQVAGYVAYDASPALAGSKAESRYHRGRWKTITRGTLHVEVGVAWWNRLRYFTADDCFGSTQEEALTKALDQRFPIGHYSATFRETIRELSLARLVTERLAA